MMTTKYGRAASKKGKAFGWADCRPHRRLLLAFSWPGVGATVLLGHRFVLQPDMRGLCVALPLCGRDRLLGNFTHTHTHTAGLRVSEVWECACVTWRWMDGWVCGRAASICYMSSVQFWPPDHRCRRRSWRSRRVDPWVPQISLRDTPLHHHYTPTILEMGGGWLE